MVGGAADASSGLNRVDSLSTSHSLRSARNLSHSAFTFRRACARSIPTNPPSGSVRPDVCRHGPGILPLPTSRTGRPRGSRPEPYSAKVPSSFLGAVFGAASDPGGRPGRADECKRDRTGTAWASAMGPPSVLSAVAGVLRLVGDRGSWSGRNDRGDGEAGRSCTPASLAANRALLAANRGSSLIARRSGRRAAARVVPR